MSKDIMFSIDVIKNYVEDEDAEFAVMRLKYLSCGENSHGIKISEDVLKKYANTILGKPIVAKYNKIMGDVRGHETDESIVGWIPSNATISFEDSNNGIFAVVDGVISKLYATDVYEMYKNINGRSVSVEFTCEYEEDDDSKPLTAFNIRGVTLLGVDIRPSNRLASSEIIRFSETDANNYYNNQFKINSLKKFAEERRRLMAETKNYKINKTELKDTPWGDVDKEELRKKVMDAKNRDTLVNAVYAIVEDGWQDAPSEHLKYPLMQEVDGTFYYNRYALSSALAYAKQENEQEVIAKVEKLYKKFKLGEGEEKKMSEEKFEIEGRETWGDVIDQVEKHEGGHVYVDSVEKDKIIYTDKDGVRYDVKADVKVGEDDKTVDAKIDWETKKKSEDQSDIHKFEDGEEDDEHEEEMSADANVDPAAYAEMLKIEANRNAELVKKMEEQENIIMGYEKELEELRKFRDERIEQDKTMAVTSALSEVQDFVDKEMFENLKSEGMACKFEEISGWQNKIKSVAFENMKKVPKKNTLWKMSAPIEEENTYHGLWD